MIEFLKYSIVNIQSSIQSLLCLSNSANQLFYLFKIFLETNRDSPIIPGIGLGAAVNTFRPDMHDPLGHIVR